MEVSRMIDQLADDDAQALARRLQHLTDDVKYDVRSGDIEHLAIYANELKALGSVIEGKYGL
jgi:hypothetical protein